MDHFGQVAAILSGRFPGEFDCKPGTQGQASGLEVRCSGRAGYAFIYEPSRPNDFLLALHETDADKNPEVWSTTHPDECVQRILPWAFPAGWTPPVPVDRAKEKQRLARIAEGVEARARTGCRVADPDPALTSHLTDEGRMACERDLASLNLSRLKRHFPWDPTGRLALRTTVLLNAYPNPAVKGRVVALAAVGPDRRRDEQEIRVELSALYPINQTHRWHDSPWMWQHIEAPELLGVPGQGESREGTSLRLLDEGRIEDALALFGVGLSDGLHRLLGGQRIRPPACCAHADAAWTDLLVTTLRQSAPWLLPSAAAGEAERVRRLTGRTPGKGPPSWKLAIFPGQFHSRKASLMLTADRDGRNPRFVIEATANNARIADTSWKRPIEADFLRYEIG